MADLVSHKTFKNNKFEVLTNSGFKDFKGVIVGENPIKIKLYFSSNKSLICTPKHKIYTSDKSYTYVQDLKVGDIIYNNLRVDKIEHLKNDSLMYDFLEVDDTHSYYSNGVLSHQCLLLDELAFIEPDSIVEDFMRSVLPTISRSKKSKILITSTPKGKNNVFYKMYSNATKEGTKEWNGFHPEVVHWSEIPDRDEDWKQTEIARLGSIEAFNQEYGCEFLDDGSSAIDAELFEELKKDCCDPKHLFEDGHYKIWEDPDPSRIYVAGVDVSEGVNQDASVIQILDITDLKEITQVAEYHNNTIAPAEFSNKLREILGHWGNPLVLIERNNQGGQVCDRMVLDFGYEKVVSWGGKKSHRIAQLYGIISHTNTKYSAVLNERYFINEIRSVKFRSLQTLNEFKTFVRYPNGAWKAKGGEHDDRVMAFIWALMILYTEITQQYFEIIKTDDFGKPSELEPMDWGTKMFNNPTSIYTNEQVDSIENSMLNPMSFGAFGEGEDEVSALLAEGWVFVNGSMPYIHPDRNMTRESYEIMDRWFS